MNDYHFTRRNMKIAIKPNLVTKAGADLLKRGLTVVYHKTSNNACPKGLFKNYVVRRGLVGGQSNVYETK